MNRSVLLVGVIWCLGAIRAFAATPPLVPLPFEVVAGPGVFQLNTETTLVADPADAAALRGFLSPSTGFALKTADSPGDNTIVLTLDAGLVGALGAEGYELVVSEQSVALRASGKEGLSHGMQTIRQLLPPEVLRAEKVGGVEWTMPCVRITDRPRFPWRGMHLDVARHYQPVGFIRKFIDLLALHKFNRLHLHLTDDQAWRVEIRKFPELTARGSSGSASDKRGDGPPMFYTQQELREIVDYARERHIVVIPEIDIPGHSRAATEVHPEWASGRSLNLQQGTIEAFQEIFRELMEVFPGPWIHVGGDEVRAGWLSDDKDLAVIGEHRIGKDNEKIQEWLQERIAEPIRAAGRTPVMWDVSGRWDMEQSAIPENTVVMSWFTVERGLRAAKAGYQVVMNPKNGTYFDYRVQRDDPIPSISLNTLRACYEWDPLPEDALDEDASARVLGTQGQLWTEQMKTPEIVENKAFPRTCALAEVAWTPQDKREFEDFEARMVTHYRRLAALGVNYYRLREPFTIVEEVELPFGRRQDVPFTRYEWDLGKHLTGPGTYRVMLHCDNWFHDLEVKDFVITVDGTPVVSLPEARFRVKHDKYDFEVKDAAAASPCVLRAEVRNAGKDKRCTFEVCIRKEAR